MAASFRTLESLLCHSAHQARPVSVLSRARSWRRRGLLPVAWPAGFQRAAVVSPRQATEPWCPPIRAGGRRTVYTDQFEMHFPKQTILSFLVHIVGFQEAGMPVTGCLLFACELR